MTTKTKMPTVGQPRFSVRRYDNNGNVRIEMTVQNAMYCSELQALVEQLGYEPTPGISNHRTINCLSPAEVDAARNPITKFFNADGTWSTAK